jgi:hypothetical protein
MVEDDGKFIMCRAENPVVSGLFLESTWKLSVVCEYFLPSHAFCAMYKSYLTIHPLFGISALRLEFMMHLVLSYLVTTQASLHLMLSAWQVLPFENVPSF